MYRLAQARAYSQTGLGVPAKNAPPHTCEENPKLEVSMIIRRKGSMQQPIESAKFTGEKKFLKVDDVADILGVSRVKVYILLINGLPSVKIDGARRIQPDKLHAVIAQH